MTLISKVYLGISYPNKRTPFSSKPSSQLVWEPVLHGVGGGVGGRECSTAQAQPWTSFPLRLLSSPGNRGPSRARREESAFWNPFCLRCWKHHSKLPFATGAKGTRARIWLWDAVSWGEGEGQLWCQRSPRPAATGHEVGAGGPPRVPLPAFGPGSTGEQ